MVGVVENDFFNETLKADSTISRLLPWEIAVENPEEKEKGKGKEKMIESVSMECW
jgi:hypothetical protein